MTRKRKIIIFALAVLFGLILNACGSGGGDDDTNATGSQWDQMSWDQGKWG